MTTWYSVAEVVAAVLALGALHGVCGLYLQLARLVMTFQLVTGMAVLVQVVLAGLDVPCPPMLRQV
jgi:hypothetical protein